MFGICFSAVFGVCLGLALGIVVLSLALLVPLFVLGVVKGEPEQQQPRPLTIER